MLCEYRYSLPGVNKENIMFHIFVLLLFFMTIYYSGADDAVLGSTINLICPSLGPIFTWNKQTPHKWEAVSNDNKYSGVNTSQLTIRDIDVTDSRIYLCYGGTYETISLNVIVYAACGSTVLWTSPFSGSSYQWQKYEQNTWIALSNNGKYRNVKTSQITILNVDDADNGQYKCSVDNTQSQAIILNTIVNGQWSEWGVWTTCSFTCGDGTRKRFHECNKPAPSNGGSYCQGLDYETESCNNGGCTVNGLWGTWGSWTACSVTCGDGNRTRYHDCNSPAPANGGSYCIGLNYDTGSCNTRVCPGLETAVLPGRENVTDASQSASIIGSVAGGVSGGIVAIVLVAVGFLIWTKSRKRSTNKQSQDYETPDITKVELHLYEERQRHNSNAIELPVHGSTSETLANKTFKTYNVRDFMELLQDKTSLNRNTKHEYQLLNVMADLKAAGDYEIIETTSGTVTAEASMNKSLIKKHDDGNGYIIRTVPGQSDIDIFWTEIIDLRARNIVLLVHKMELISEVFPTTDMSVNTSKFNVELASSEKYPNNIFAFCLAVWNKDKKTEVQVKLYKTTDWKVGEKHPSIDTLCKLLDVVSDQESGLVAFLESNAITFRVCGCLGVCHEVFYAIKAERGFNIPQVAVDLKRMRPDLFQTYEEYNLCYKIIGHFLENQTIYAVID